jgi:hypothetical protein
MRPLENRNPKITACAILAASLAWGAAPARAEEPEPSGPPDLEQGSPDGKDAIGKKDANSEKSAPDEKALKSFQAAALDLESSTDVEDSLRALKVLRSGFPKSRPVLHECVERRSSHVKCFALEILGELGKAKEDMEVAAKGLKDTHPKVRLAAVMALQRLGKSGSKHIEGYLPGEQDPNNKKMALKTLQRYGDKAAVPTIVRVLRDEKDKGVRNFAVNALEVLTSKKFGDDVKAWEDYSQEIDSEAQTRELMDVKKLLKEEKR